MMMTRLQHISLVVTLLLTAACSTQAPTRHGPGPPRTTAVAPAGAVPASELADHEGDAAETAVIVPADAPDEGVAFENDWIFQRYGKFRRLGGGTGKMGERRYDVIEIELWGGGTRKVYFDITENWARWTRPGAKP